jgi:hypothetical protein
MSRGPGYVQRRILQLIADNPDGSWTTAHLADLVYGDLPAGYLERGEPLTDGRLVWALTFATIPRSRKSAIARALNTMALPQGWVYRQGRDLHHRLYHSESDWEIWGKGSVPLA